MCRAYFSASENRVEIGRTNGRIEISDLKIALSPSDEEVTEFEGKDDEGSGEENDAGMERPWIFEEVTARGDEERFGDEIWSDGEGDESESNDDESDDDDACRFSNDNSDEETSEVCVVCCCCCS